MADVESHIIPLAPSRIHHRSDEPFPTMKPGDRRQRRSNKCVVYILFAVVILSVAFLGFGLTVLRIKSPDAELRLITVRNLQYGFSPLASLNLSLIGEVRVRNKNFGRFEFGNSTLKVEYGNVTMGTANINKGSVESRTTKGMSLRIQLRSNNVLSTNANFSSDIGQGLVWLRSYSTIRGEVHAMKIFNRRATAEMNCSMGLNLTTHTIQGLLC